MRVAIGIRCPARFDIDERSDVECSDRAAALHRKPVADTTRIVRVRCEIIGIDSDDRGEEGLGLQVGAETSQRFAQTTNESRDSVTNRDESSRVVEAVQPPAVPVRDAGVPPVVGALATCRHLDTGSRSTR